MYIHCICVCVMATEVSERSAGHKSTSKQDVLAKIIALENRLMLLERERAGGVFSKRSEFRALYSGLEEAELKAATQRRTQKAELKASMARIQANIVKFQALLTDMRPGPSFVETLKKAMEDIELSIAAFKESQRAVYEQLLTEEQLLSQEVTICERRLELWASNSTPQNRPTYPVSLTTASSTVPPAVQDFDQFLGQTGGHEGGWEREDHQTFVKIRAKFNAHPSYLESAVNELLTKTVEEVRQHDHWYTEYCSLLEGKRRAIAEWRRLRKAAQKPKGSPKDEETDKRSKVKEKRLAKEQQERFEKLKEWKTHQLAREREAAELRERDKTHQQQLHQREIQRKAAVKARVEQYTREKELSRMAERKRLEEERRKENEQRRIANRGVERFRERDMQQLEERRSKALQKEQLVRERALALEKIKQAVVVERDPSRLLRLTAGWEERQKAGVNEVKGGRLLTLPRRAVPSWRQGL